MLGEVKAAAGRLIVGIEEASRWAKLRGVGNSGLVRLTILIPVIGYLILFNNEVVRHLQLDSRLRIFASEYPLRLLLFYYGSFIAAAGSLLYAWRCPPLLKKYPSAVEYVESESDFFSIPAHFQSLCDGVVAALQNATPWQSQVPQIVKASRLPLLGGPSYRPAHEELVEVLTVDWHLKNIGQRGTRVLCLVLFSAGFIVLSVPTLWTFLEITISLLLSPLESVR